MCGITIFLSKHVENIMPDIIKSLNQIQNRGYDSAGLAINNNNNWEIQKFASSDTSDGLSTLSQNTKDIISNISMGHTRWATHGAKSDINAHPHMSANGLVIIVHNGIITNYKDIKDRILQPNNIFCKSETDTEVIANLIEYYLMKDNLIKDAIKMATDQLQGTWALGIIHTVEYDKVYITRHGSPLLVGENDNTIIGCSETSGFVGLIHNYIIIENHDIITISKDGYISDKIYKTRIVQNQGIDNSLEPFSHWTLKEIYEQPKTIMAAMNNGARILNNNIILGGLENLKLIIKAQDINHIIVLGCGTSYNVSMFAKYYFEKSTTNISTVQAYDASEFSEVDIPSTGTTLCIVCSQSGETRDIISCIEICKRRNCILIGIVNVVDSMIAQSVDCGVYLNAGYERAVASTKSFTSSLIILSLIGMWFRIKHKNIPVINCLRGLPDKVEILLNDPLFKSSCDNLVNLINNKQINSLFILGRGKMFAIAREGALKIKELSYIHAEGYSSSSLKHGPFALLDNKTLSLLLIDENTVENLMITYHEICSRETNCYVLTDSAIDITENVIKLPKNKYYQEILFAIALQYLSYQLSISKGINPDKPRNLAKVVTVE